MRRLLISALTLCLLVALAGPAAAHPTAALEPTLPTDLTYAATDNISYLGRFPEHTGTAGGMRLGERYYVTDPRGVYVYDVAGDKARAPELLGSLLLFQTETGAALAQEDPNTNGEILVVDGSDNPFAGAQLTVVDVSDPTDLKVLSTLDVVDHTWTCVTGIDDEGEQNSCAYVFGRTGHIVDLTDPANPVNLPVTWRRMVDYGDRDNSPYTHDLTEIRPGLVFSAGEEAILMDTSRLLDAQAEEWLGMAPPAAPAREIARINQNERFSSLGYHSVEWAVDDDGSLDPWVVVGTEIAPSGATNAAGSDCDSPDSVIETWDAREVVAAIEDWEAGEATFDQAFGGAAAPGFTKVDAFNRPGRGLYVDGNAPAHVLYCAHWMELHPDFDAQGGWIATSYYDRGTRFVAVNADGTFAEESAWIVPFQGYSGSVQWVDTDGEDDVLYIHDYTRGLEVIAFSGESPTGTHSSDTSALALTSNFTPPATFHIDSLLEALAPISMIVLGLGVLVVQRRRRLA